VRCWIHQLVILVHRSSLFIGYLQLAPHRERSILQQRRAFRDVELQLRASSSIQSMRLSRSDDTRQRQEGREDERGRENDGKITWASPGALFARICDSKFPGIRPLRSADKLLFSSSAGFLPLRFVEFSPLLRSQGRNIEMEASSGRVWLRIFGNNRIGLCVTVPRALFLFAHHPFLLQSVCTRRIAPFHFVSRTFRSENGCFS